MKILVGCDPEVFVKRNGVLVSAHGLIKGTKENPFKVERGAVQVDGMALEFNTDPAESEDEFYLNVTTVFNTLKQMCPDYEIVTEPVARFGAEYIKAQPDEAKELGCDPDYNGWTGLPNPKPDANGDIRTASGHVHIGWCKDVPMTHNHVELCGNVAKQMDFFLGLPSLFYDEDTERRTLYGKGGAFRPKSYGMEYRTLSNAWLKDANKIRWVYRQVQEGVKKMIDGFELSNVYGDISSIINNSDKEKAMAIIKAERIQMV